MPVVVVRRMCDVGIVLRGTLLTDSLRVGATVEVDGLRAVRIVRRDVSTSVTVDQPQVWTFLEFEAEDHRAQHLADALAEALSAEGGWYADFTTGRDHVVVFARRVFRYRMGDVGARAEVEAYGRAVGVPDHQLDWTDS